MSLVVSHALGSTYRCITSHEGVLQSFRYSTFLVTYVTRILTALSILLFTPEKHASASADICSPLWVPRKHFSLSFFSFFAFLPVLAMSVSHLNKSPLLGNNLIEGECIAKEET